jgi:hypothetical protein
MAECCIYVFPKGELLNEMFFSLLTQTGHHLEGQIHSHQRWGMEEKH